MKCDQEYRSVGRAVIPPSTIPLPRDRKSDLIIYVQLEHFDS